MNLREWRKSKGWGQEELAGKIGSNQKTYSAYETGRLKDIPPDIQAKIRRLGYQGPWPAQEAPAGGAMPEEVVKLKGRVEALEGQLLAALVAAKSLDQRVQVLERRAGLSE